MGRPTKYLKSKHPIEFVEFSSQGLTKSEICTQWGISRETLNQWSKDSSKPEFSDAIKGGETALEAWFCSQFRLIGARGCNPSALPALIWLSKNCIGWGREDSPNERHQVITLKYSLDRKPKASEAET